MFGNGLCKRRALQPPFDIKRQLAHNIGAMFTASRGAWREGARGRVFQQASREAAPCSSVCHTKDEGARVGEDSRPFG
jgi:hypothetical protein